jgi:spermidine synthase
VANPKTDAPRAVEGSERRLVLLSVGALGASAVMTQLALLRELLCAFNGNELVVGGILAGWLFLTGLGTRLGRLAARARSPAVLFGLAQVSLALLPLAQVFGLRAARNLVFLRGADVGLGPALLSSLGLLAPYCLVSGMMLTLACAWLSQAGVPALAGPPHDSQRAQTLAARPPEGGTLAPIPGGTRAVASAMGRVYVADSLGSIAGGALFSFVLVPFLDHFALLCLPAFVNLLMAVAIGWRYGRRWLAGLAAVLAAGLAGGLTLANPDALSTALQFAPQEVVFRGHSPYGRLVVTRQDGELNFIHNGLPLVSTRNVERGEEAVHYAMAQRPEAQQVLLISSALAGTAGEVLKYGASEVTGVEPDPLLIQAQRQFMPKTLADPRLTVLQTDPRSFLRHCRRRFEVIIADLPDPATAQVNRFYTQEFFQEARRSLVDGGVLCFGLGHYENVISPELARLLASTHQTAQSVFAHVRMIPGGRVFFLVSDGALTDDFAGRLEAARVATQLIKRSYLNAMLAPDRRADLDRAVAQPASLNTDFDPVLYFHHLRLWLSQFDTRAGWGVLAGALVLVVYLARLPAPAFTVFASGFAASTLEVALLLGFQVLQGSLYWQLGVVVTLFMAGLATGAHWANRTLALRRRLGWTALGLAGFAVVLPLGLRGLGHRGWPAVVPGVVPVAVSLATFTLALLVGLQFPWAGQLEKHGAAETASRLYTADFTGACLGALLASAWLIPVRGLTQTCWLVGALNLLAAAALFSRKLKP